MQKEGVGAEGGVTERGIQTEGVRTRVGGDEMS